MVERTAMEENNEKRMKRSDSLRDLWDTLNTTSELKTYNKQKPRT